MKDKFLAFVKRFWRAFWGSLSHNLRLKLLSLVLAILLWSFVVTSNPTITRSKTISGIDAYVTNEAVLNANRLALAEDPAEALSGVSVQLNVPQSSYALADASNVQVTLDLSSVRTAGSQEVALRATTAYGSVVRIMPESVTLEFEAYDSRTVPVNAALTGEQSENMWYNINRVNPEELVISGPSSLIQTIASAYVYVDVTERTSSFITAARFALNNYGGEEVAQTLLSSSSSSVTVGVDVYPTKELPVSNEVADVVRGQTAEGYQITGITIQPETITVAADAELLEGLTELLIEPISLNGAQQSFSQRARISSLTGFKNVTPEQVYVNVTIEEIPQSARVPVNLSYINCPDGMTFTYTREDFTALVTGPGSSVEALRESGVDAVVDLAGLEEGEHTLPITVDETVYPGLAFAFEPSQVTLRLDGAGSVD